MEYLNICRELEYIINFRIEYYIIKIDEQVNNLINGYVIKIINNTVPSHELIRSIIYYDDDYKFTYYAFLHLTEEEKNIKIKELEERRANIKNKVATHEIIILNKLHKIKLIEHIINIINLFNNSLPLNIKELQTINY